MELFITLADSATEVDLMKELHDASEEEGEEEAPFDQRVHYHFLSV